MSKVQLVVIDGYGTERNPYIGGTTRTVDVDVDLGENGNIRRVIVPYSSRSLDEVLPVVPHEFINNLVGRLMTLVDLSFNDAEQKKAFRELLIERVWSWYHGQCDRDPGMPS